MRASIRFTSPEPEDAELVPQRRVRQITSVQIRNLTPFPARDAFTTALTEPSQTSQFTDSGRHADDFDVTLARRRTRKMSSSSVTTLRTLGSFKSDGSPEGHRDGSTGGARGRKRADSKGSVFEGQAGEASHSPTRRRRISTLSGKSVGGVSMGSSPTLRATRGTTRPSMLHIPSSSTIDSSFPSSSAFSLDSSQSGLEKVLKSRLVETFIAISVESLRAPGKLETEETPVSPKMPALSPPHSPNSQKMRSAKGSPSIQTSSAPLSPRTSSPHMTAAIPPSLSRLSHASTSGSTLTAGSQAGPLAPNYLSPIHRPSTNPIFSIDPDRFASATELGSHKCRIQLMGRISGMSWGSCKGKGKETAAPSAGSAISRSADEDWTCLAEWDVDMDQLLPVPVELADRPSRLPSNTLLISLSPYGQTYYLPQFSSQRQASSSLRAPSPDAGYASDPEVQEARKARTADKADMDVPFTAPVTRETFDTKGGRPPSRGRDHVERKGRRKDSPTTASFHDLVKLVTLQTCIADMNQSLAGINANIERFLQEDSAASVNREVSERDFCVKGLKENRESVDERSDDLRHRIEMRREELRQRRAMLALAREMYEVDQNACVEAEDRLTEERHSLSSLQQQILPARANVITTLASTFPIDLVSPADLLFTILGVPLPIPTNATDPAPPLSLASHKDVNEDNIATALGYAAQVVQLLAAYLGKRLVYPITYVGSRSLVKDEISAMMGPRMFPLYSKGVDTYRFEYAVFLLNKDIELLMADRDLRALDTRHTLPNLKNLLLTLTDGEQTGLIANRLVLNASTSSLAELESVIRAASPGATPTPTATQAPSSMTPTTPSLIVTPETPRAKPAQLNTEAANGAMSASTSIPDPAGGDAVTPTAEGTGTARKSYLSNLSPLAGLGFLRYRMPSSSRISAKASPDVTVTVTSTISEPADGAPATATVTSCAEDEEDRRTLRGVRVDEAGEGKVANGNGNVHGEKAAADTPLGPPSLVTRAS